MQYEYAHHTHQLRPCLLPCSPASSFSPGPTITPPATVTCTAQDPAPLTNAFGIAMWTCTTGLTGGAVTMAVQAPNPAQSEQLQEWLCCCLWIDTRLSHYSCVSCSHVPSHIAQECVRVLATVGAQHMCSIRTNCCLCRPVHPFSLFVYVSHVQATPCLPQSA